jgi:Caspase domain
MPPSDTGESRPEGCREMARRALLVGLDVYPDPRNNLNSCVADTLVFKNMLQSTYGFSPGAITLLHNQNATLANVRAGLDVLFAGAHAGDQLVYFESSHGYQYPEGDTMVEVLCLYDGFLTDTEFVGRTQSLPPDVLTVVLDACHSGGVNKVFFVDESQQGASVQVARSKVWQPSAEESARNLQLYTQVTKFKFFGRASTSDAGAVAKNFELSDHAGIPAPKEPTAGAPDLNGALFAACAADETAAAGSPQTNNLSAFTYGLTTLIDTTLSLGNLKDRVGARLTQLHMSQHPQALVPFLHPELYTSTFITVQPTGAPTPSQPPAGGGGGPDGFDPIAWLRENLRL